MSMGELFKRFVLSVVDKFAISYINVCTLTIVEMLTVVEMERKNRLWLPHRLVPPINHKTTKEVSGNRYYNEAQK